MVCTRRRQKIARERWPIFQASGLNRSLNSTCRPARARPTPPTNAITFDTIYSSLNTPHHTHIHTPNVRPRQVSTLHYVLRAQDFQVNSVQSVLQSRDQPTDLQHSALLLRLPSQDRQLGAPDPIRYIILDEQPFYGRPCFFIIVREINRKNK